MTFLRPLDWKSVGLVEAYDRRLLVINGIWALIGAFTKDAWSWNNVLANGTNHERICGCDKKKFQKGHPFCCGRSLRAIYFTYFSAVLCLCRRMVMKTFFMLTDVATFAEGAVRKKVKNEELPVVPRFWYRPCDLRKKLLQLFLKNGAWTKLCVIAFQMYWLAAPTRISLFRFQEKSKVPSSRSDMPSVPYPFAIPSIVSTILKILWRWRNFGSRI